VSTTSQQIAERHRAAHLLFDALEAAGVYCERDTGVVDATGSEIVAALIAANWTPPPASRVSEPDTDHQEKP
jgi:hypothetical protein